MILADIVRKYTSFKESDPNKEAEDTVMKRASDKMGGDGPAFYIMTALKVQYDRATELKEQYPTFADFANYLLDATDKERERQKNLQNDRKET